MTPMTETLESALTGMTTNERLAVSLLLLRTDDGGNVALTRLHRGLVAEIVALDERDAATLAALEAASQDIG